MARPVVDSNPALRDAIEAEVRRYFDDGATVAAAYGPQFCRLWESAANHVLGGKLVRPILTVSAFDALLGESAAEHPHRPSAIRLAAAIEVLHYAFLLHDDVIDGDIMRRGRPNLIGHLMADHATGRDASHGLLSPDLHWARTGAILMGDLLLSHAHQVFARASVDEATRIRLLDALDHAIVETVAGEHTDVALSHGMVEPDLATILSMTAYKTATYSFELPLKVATALAGADAGMEPSLVDAGRYLGLAFQMQDDLLSTFGDASEHGKDAYSDLREGKQTVIMAYARMTSTWPSIEVALAAASTDEDFAAVTEALDHCGARRYVAQMIDGEIDALHRVATQSTPQVPPALQTVILGMAASLEGRRV